MTRISALPETFWLDESHQYNDQDVKDIFRRLHIDEIFRNGREEEIVKLDVIDRVKYETRLLKTSKCKDWPKIQNLLSRDIKKLNLIREKYIKELTTFTKTSAPILNSILFEATLLKQPIYKEATELNIMNSGDIGSLNINKILEHMRRNDEYLSHIIQLIPKDLDKIQAGRPKTSPIVSRTIGRLCLLYAEITNDDRIGIDGPLQQFIEACLKPVDIAWKKKKEQEQIFIAEEENDSFFSVRTILQEMKKRKQEEEVLQKEHHKTPQ